MLEILKSIKIYAPAWHRTGVPDGPLTILRQQQNADEAGDRRVGLEVTEDPRDLSSNLVVLGREA
jgi:hypothetical protein